MTLEAAVEKIDKATRKRKSYKTLYNNEVKNHEITRQFHEKLILQLRNTEEAVYPSFWSRFKGFVLN